MTNKEYLIAQLGFAPSAHAVEAALIDLAITGSDTYSVGNSIALKTAAVSLLHILLSAADTVTGTGETSSSIKYDRDAILKRIARLESEIGLTGASPTIKGIRPW